MPLECRGLVSNCYGPSLGHHLVDARNIQRVLVLEVDVSACFPILKIRSFFEDDVLCIQEWGRGFS